MSKRTTGIDMAKSTGIILTATAISFTNEWVQTNTPNFRIGMAGLALALIMDGVERVNEQVAVGLSVIAMITLLVTPLNGKSPAETLLSLSKGTK
jgi:hypothetical protein